MQGSRILKILIVLGVVFVGWHWWATQRRAPAPTAADRTSPAVNCQFEARSANDYFGSRIGSFTNPPYDMQAWDQFKSEVDSRISRAESKCNCSDPQCTRATEAMNELRSMAGELDSAIRSGGSPPTDLVQRQERVNQGLE